MLKQWVILDRDGTLIKEEHYLSEPEKVSLLPGVVEGLRLLANAGCLFFMVTNQSGIGRGYFSELDMNAVNDRLLEILDAHGICMEGIFFCPHTPDDKCDCRKPNTGLVVQAVRKLGFTMEEICCVIGDKRSDLQLAENLGCNSVLVLTGHGREEKELCGNVPCVVDDFFTAAQLILENGWMEG